MRTPSGNSALVAGALGLGALGLGALAYAHWESRRFTVRRFEIDVLPTGQPPLKLLHLSDLHMLPGQREKAAWVASLVELRPDAVIATGDFLSHRDAVPAALAALGPLLELPGAFVLGSNDYFAPRVINPAKYLRGPSQLEPSRAMLPWPALVRGLTEAGWLDLTNARDVLKADGRQVDIRGVDDPHISRDNYAAIAGAFDTDADLALGVTHAPYLRVLDGMAGDGAHLVLAGHTHGGQLRLPGYGALVTNCDLDTRRARGLSSHVAGGNRSTLHVSAGLGTSPYAPFRFACPPEASLLTLVAR